MIDLRDPNVVQTEDMCIEAVKQNGSSLMYVKNKTKDICIEAVKQNCQALICMPNQTDDICLEAVKQYGFGLMFVRNQTDAICLEALAHHDNNIWSTSFGSLYRSISYPTPQLINKLLKLYPSYTNSIMTNHATSVIKTYKTGIVAISSIVQHANDILYRPNNVIALCCQANWHTCCDAKTLFLV